MPQTEFTQMLMTGEKATIVGPGVVEFKTLLPGAAVPTAAKTAGAAKAMGAGGIATQGFVTTTGATAAKSVPASILSGKVFGLSLGTLNPWVLLGIGVVGGYMVARKKYPRLVW